MSHPTPHIVALVLLGLASVFQAALALAVPWGAMAYGGRAARADGTLPVRYRVASTLTLAFLGAAAWSLQAKVAPAHGHSPRSSPATPWPTSVDGTPGSVGGCQR